MPKSAVDTGVVDLILAPGDVPEALTKYLRQQAEGGRDEPLGPEAGDALARIFALLRRDCGIDFTDYKASTVGRRVERRLLLSSTASMEDYLRRLSDDPGELRALYKDLLIGVTRFFRDPEAFERLASEVLPALVDRTPEGEELRAWVPGCATGEEPYSLAILLNEVFASKRRAPVFRIFATDVHHHSLEQASAGVFAPESLENVPAPLRERYFSPHPDGLQISAELRGRIVFAHHNVVRDAPFTRLDLLTCRNLLIYFKAQTQQRVLTLFHFALKPGGVLVLGPSETPGALGDEFGTIDARWKVFRKTRDVRLTSDVRLGGAGPVDRVGRLTTPGLNEDGRVMRLRATLLERYAPPTVLVDETARLLHSVGGASEFFSPRDGKPSLNLLDLLQGELRFVVAGALKRVQKDKHPVTYTGIVATTAKGPRRVRIVVSCIEASERAPECYAVSFEPDAALASEVETADANETPAQARAGKLLEERLSSVEGELRVAKENLQATVEEMETSNEELQATNEELIASNEELQSTNEELHSVNEELYTVNAEYQTKINELTELHADMNHLLEATDVNLIFLDRQMRLRKFTPRIAAAFNLLPQDVGRRLDVFAHNFADPDLITDVARVAQHGSVVEREITDQNGKCYFLRILPYNAQNSLEGIVVTFIDISAVKRAQGELSASEERYRTLVRSVSAVMWTADADGRFASPQSEWEAYTGHPHEVHEGNGWLTAIHPDDRASVAEAWDKAVRERRPFESTARLYSKAHGEHRYVVMRAAPLLLPGSQVADTVVREWVGHAIDVHDARLAEHEVRRKDAQMRAILDNSPAFIWVKDLHGRYLVAGRQCEAVLGVPCDELTGKTDHELLPAAVAQALHKSEGQVVADGTTVESEEMVPVHGELRTFLTVKFPMRDERGAIYAVGGISTDITERKRQAEEIKTSVERRDQFIAMLSHELRTPLGAILNAADLAERHGGNGNGNANGHPSTAREIIRRQTRHMAKLLEDLLDVGRITRDQLLLEPQRLDLRSVIEEALEVVRVDADRKHLELRVHLPPEEVPVFGDVVRLRQVFTNLLTNAVAYTPGGWVGLTARVVGGRVSVAVKDSGIGLDAGERSRVFDLFYQAPQTIERKRGGLGVGLTLALKLVQLHGGELHVDSEGLHQGSTFTVTLPITDRPAVVVVPQLSPSTPGRLRIVVVEDNQDIRDTLEDLLRLDGHEVTSAKEGIEGAQSIVESCPDVAIVDVGLPGMDGYAVAKAVRAARGRSVRLIALTGYGRREDRLEAAKAGFDRHLVKPVDHELLSRALAEVLAQRSSEATLDA